MNKERSVTVDSLEKMLDAADFSKESSQRNQLYYKLFHEPVPVSAGRAELLSMESLALVSGGREEIPDVKKDIVKSGNPLEESKENQ